MDAEQNAVIIKPQGIHQASVIWLHGLGADGHDFETIVPELGLREKHGIQFIFPHAPVRPVTINGGMAMRAWYDVRDNDLGKMEDAESIRDSATILNNFIDTERNAGISSEKILLAGFSQGGAIALHAGLRYPQKLAGILGLSTYLPLTDQLAVEAEDANADISIMMMHGIFDPVIPVYQGQHSRELLQQAGYQLEWHDYPMQHAVCPEQIQTIGRWLQTRLLNLGKH